MSQKTVYTIYRFSGINYLVYTDDNKWYWTEGFGLKQKTVRYKNGRNGLYLKNKFVSIKKLRKLAYPHRELLIEKITDKLPF